MDESLDDDMLQTILGHSDLDLWPSFQNYHVWSILPILLDLGIPNLLCGFIL